MMRQPDYEHETTTKDLVVHAMRTFLSVAWLGFLVWFFGTWFPAYAPKIARMISPHEEVIK